MNTQREIGNDTNNASARYHVINPSVHLTQTYMLVPVIRLLIYRRRVGRILCNLVFDDAELANMVFIFDDADDDLVRSHAPVCIQRVCLLSSKGKDYVEPTYKFCYSPLLEEVCAQITA